MNILLLMSVVALPPVMPVSEIQHGQVGQCLTVFEGDAIEPFPFLVKGVMRNFLGPGKHVVLIRLQGDKAEFTGVVAGMSGSPCSIDGKLVGALAYSFAIFAKEPIAGITPMDSMLDVMRIPEEQRPWRLPGGDEPGWQADWKAFRDGKESVIAARKQFPASASDLRPIATPLSMGGVVPRVRAHFEPWLRSVGFEPVAGGVGSGGASSSGAAGQAKGPPLRAGSAVTAVLVRGDVEIAATGTVTSVEGDQVLAFGHPFFGAGAISVPMASAQIINTMASQMRSFKMSIVGPTIGEITQDRLTAIGGYLGRKPKMIPVRGKISTPRGAESYTFEVARDLQLTPRFVAVGLSNALSGRVDANERGTVRLRGQVQVAGMKPVKVENVYSAQRDGNLLMYSAVDVAQTFAALWSTPFGPPPDIQVEVEAELSPEPVEEWIESVHLDRLQARPGEPVEVAVRLQRYHGEEIVERFLLQVPRSWAGDDVQIVVGGADAAQQLTEGVAGPPRPRNLQQVARWLSRRRADGHVYLMAIRKGAGMRSRVDEMPFLPPSVVATLSDDPSGRVRRSGLAWEERRARPGVVYGQRSVGLTVLSR